MVVQGLIAGLVGAITIWIYEFIVFHVAMKNSTALGVVQHTAVLVYGPSVMNSPVFAFALGFLIHCATGMAWGVVFALIWPFFRRRAVEASLLAIPFGGFAWVVMHNIVLAIFSPAPPVYTAEVVINGMLSHMVAFSIPVALTVKYLAGREPAAGLRLA